MRHEARTSLPSEPMKGFSPNFLTRLHGRVLERLACWRLARWCKRVRGMTDEQFSTMLKLAVIGGSATQEIQDPLDWLYRAMRDAGAKAGSLQKVAHPDHVTTFAQPFHVRLVSAITQLAPERYALLASFMWGARCEDVAEWQTTSQEEIAARVNQIARELATHVFGTRP